LFSTFSSQSQPGGPSAPIVKMNPLFGLSAIGSHRLFWSFGIVVLVAITAIRGYAAPVLRFPGPTSSQPLALTADGTTLLVANPDNNSVSIFDVKDDHNVLIDKVNVGKEPNGVAVLPGGGTGYSANTVAGTVSVIKLNGSASSVKKTIAVGRALRPRSHSERKEALLRQCSRLQHFCHRHHNKYRREDD
jgi:YVTN family beta-propeller protein